MRIGLYIRLSITLSFAVVFMFAYSYGIAQEPTPSVPLFFELDAQIAFTSGIDGIEDVYLMSLNDLAPINLTNRGDASSPAWSPNGGKIAFVAYSDGNHEIYVANADGSEQTRLTNNDAPDMFPAWSPDGGKIAFTSYRDGNPEVYVMDADGSNPYNLTCSDMSDGEGGLSWSPDGTHIVFASNRDQPDTVAPDNHSNLYIIDVNNLSVTRLTDTEFRIDTNPAWSPSGDKIAFVSDRSLVWEIYVFEIETGNITLLTHVDFEEAGYPPMYMFPAWSPDGRQIAFSACAEHLLDNCEIFLMTADGSGLTQLTDDNDVDLHPVWRP